MNVVPVTSTIIDWLKFVKTINDLTGRSPTRLLDQSKIGVGDLSSYICAISYFCSELSPFEVAKYSPTVFKHVSLGFLFEINEKQYFSILKETDLICTDNYGMKDDEKIVLITGNLLQWKNAITIFCHPSHPPKTRLLFNELYNYFSQIGLAILFDSFSKKMLDGNQFVLEAKER